MGSLEPATLALLAKYPELTIWANLGLPKNAKMAALPCKITYYAYLMNMTLDKSDKHILSFNYTIWDP